ncbi:MAG: uroporphyrinogen-III synthase [Bacteroidia bacterium]
MKILEGKKILITRPIEQSQSWGEELQNIGAEVHTYPLIKIVSLVDSPEIKQALHELEMFDWLIFTSTNGVSSFFEACQKYFSGNAYMQKLPKMATVGPATTEELAKYKLQPQITPQRFTGNDLAAAFGDVKGLKILFPTTTIFREDLSGQLAKRGADLHKIPFYDTQFTSNEGAGKLSEIINKGLDIVTFASPSAVRSFHEKMIAAGIKMKEILLACIGPATSAEARKLGFKVDIEAENFTTGGLTEAIIKHYESVKKQAAPSARER